jgi:hypothetical protein
MSESFRINEWLALRKYSRAEWYRMKARGDGPETIGKGRMERITPEGDAKFLRQQRRKAAKCDSGAAGDNPSA